MKEESMFGSPKKPVLWNLEIIVPHERRREEAKKLLVRAYEANPEWQAVVQEHCWHGQYTAAFILVRDGETCKGEIHIEAEKIVYRLLGLPHSLQKYKLVIKLKIGRTLEKLLAA